MKKIISSIFASLLLSGCVSATVDVESACSSKEISFPGVPVAVSVLAGERTASVKSTSDMSGIFEKLSTFATAKVNSVSLKMDSKSDLLFLHHVFVTIHATNFPKNELVLSDADFSGMDLPITVDREKLLVMLSEGPVTLVFTGTGNIPTEATSASANFCIGVTAHAEKSLSDIGR